MFQRTADLASSNSFFLFGPRGTGKTTLLRSRFSPVEAYFIDLLDPSEEDVLARDPVELVRRLDALPPERKWVVLDEVQRVPRLLDVVHRLIEDTALRFAMTGSSGRKLRRGASNLLAGRAFVHHLHPLTRAEVGDRFDLTFALRWGTLPKVFTLSSDEERAQYLRAYAHTYLREEIVAEQVVRRLDPFRLFLEVAAQCSGQIVNYTRIADDVGVDVKTVQSYFSVLDDTMIGVLLPAYHRSVRRRQRANPKFYLFDPGVKRALDRSLTVGLAESTPAFGLAFEHFVILEIMRRSDYASNDWAFSYLRTKDDAEIDLVIERPAEPTALVELKSTRHVTDRDVATLVRFASDLPACQAFCLSRDTHPKRFGAVHALPWERGLVELGI